MQSFTKQEVKDLMCKIKTEYGNHAYQQISGDTHFTNVPETLWKLWYSDGSYKLAICNMDTYFRKVLSGEKKVESVYKDIYELKEALANEFELLKKENIMKGNEYL